VRDLNHHTKEHAAISFLYLRYGEFLRSTRYSKLLPIQVADGISGLLKFITLIRAKIPRVFKDIVSTTQPNIW
jgi:hypothetical protein